MAFKALFVYTSTNLWSKLSCQLDIRWLGKPQKTVCQQLPEVRQVGGHGVGLNEEKKRGVLSFFLFVV